MRITDYSFGRVRVAGRAYTADLIVLPDRVLPNWRRRSGHELLPEDLEDIVAGSAEVLVVGTGAVGAMRVPRRTVEFLRERGVRAEVMRTGLACERFNELSVRSEAVAAALHLTC